LVFSPAFLWATFLSGCFVDLWPVFLLSEFGFFEESNIYTFSKNPLNVLFEKMEILTEEINKIEDEYEIILDELK